MQHQDSLPCLAISEGVIPTLLLKSYGSDCLVYHATNVGCIVRHGLKAAKKTIFV